MPNQHLALENTEKNLFPNWKSWAMRAKEYGIKLKISSMVMLMHSLSQ